MRRLIGAIVAIVLLQFGMVTAQEDGTEFSKPELSVLAHEVDFPTVNVRVRVSDAGRPVPPLERSNFEIQGEDYQDLRASREETALNLAIVIDLVQDITIEPIRAALNAYFSQYYREGDNIAFVTIRDETVSLTQPASLEEILTFVNSLSNPVGYNAYRPGLEEAERWLEGLTAQGQNGQILVIGTYFGRSSDPGDAVATAGRLLEQSSYPVHVIHAHNPGQFERFSSGYELVAQRGGGRFVNYRGEADLAALRQLYDAIQANRLVYLLSYETLSGEEGERTVEVLARLDEKTFRGELVYEAPPLEDPRVQITSLSDGDTIEREPLAEGSSDLTPTSLTVEAQVSFPDDFEREIVQADLVISTTEGNIRQEMGEPAIDADGNMRLRWDLSGFDANPEGGIVETSVTLQVEVTDEYGNTSVGFVDVVVVVDTPVVGQDASTNGTTTTGGGSGSGPDDAGDGAVAGSTDAGATDVDEGVDGATTDNTIWYVAIGVMTVALIGVTFYALRQNKKLRDMVVPQAAQRTMMNMASGLQKTMVGMSRMGRSDSDNMEATMVSGKPPAPAGPSAYLEVLRGPDEGRQLPIQGAMFTIGRQQGSGIDYATTGFRNVSGQHCRIIQSGGGYKVIDLGSSNGTYLNGQKLQPNAEYPISSHSVIQLGKDENSSVQFRFVSSGGGGGAMMKTELDQPGYAPPGKQQGGDWYLGKTQTFEDGSPGVQPSPPSPSPPSSGGGHAPPPPRRQSDPGEWDRIDQLPQDDDWLRQ